MPDGQRACPSHRRRPGRPGQPRPLRRGGQRLAGRPAVARPGEQCRMVAEDPVQGAAGLPERRPGRLAAGVRAELLRAARSEEHTSELQSLMRISYAVFCLKKKKTNNNKHTSLATQ